MDSIMQLKDVFIIIFTSAVVAFVVVGSYVAYETIKNDDGKRLH
jgi:hypothetical protein